MLSPLAEAGLLPLGDRDYADTLVWKRRTVEEAFRRRDLRASVAETHPSPRERGARARITLRADRGRLGFFRPGTHEFVEVPLDDLARPEVVSAAAAIAGSGEARGQFELRSDGERVVVNGERAFRGPPDFAVEGRRLRGNPNLNVGGLRVSPGSFYQVNLELNAALAARVDSLLVALKPAALLDLYGGIGNLSVTAARRGVPVTLVESSPAAAGDAVANLRGTPARVERMDVAKVEAGQFFADVVLLDPPRAGATGVLPRLALTRPRAILYVSCDPVSLARDVSQLQGYEIASVEPWDMFPYADHVETLCVLERRDR